MISLYLNHSIEMPNMYYYKEINLILYKDIYLKKLIQNNRIDN